MRHRSVWRLFIVLLISGGVWLTTNRLLPTSFYSSLVIVGMGIVFVGVLLTLLISRVRELLHSTAGLVWKIGFIGLDLSLLILTFAWSYQMDGIIDNVRPGSPVTTDFLTCVYYSIVTFTTLGYGDFYPQGAGRALAALEALTGYLVLGILASTGVSVISPHQPPKLSE